MAESLAWCVVIILIGVGVTGATGAAGLAMQSVRRHGSGPPALVLGASSALLLALAALWKVEGLARADGWVVGHLAGARSNTLDGVMSVLTTTGDLVPCFTIAGILAILIARQGRHRVLPWFLPVIVLAELLVQFAFGAVFHDVEIGAVQAGLPIGGAGTIPSGSTARLMSVFLVASLLWSSHNRRGADLLRALGIVVLTMEIVTRLYLARHLLADIAAGLLFGVVLAGGFTQAFRVFGGKLQREDLPLERASEEEAELRA